MKLMFYRIDKIEQSPQKEAIYLMISENDLFFSQPDNNTDALQHLLTSIAGRTSQEVDTVLNVHRQSRTNIMTSNESIFKDKRVLMVYAMPYMFQGLRVTKLFFPTLMFQWQACASEIACPFLSHMVHVLLWLASPEKIDLKAVNTVDLVNELVTYSAEALNSVLDTTFFDSQFFQILEDSYMDYLKPAMITFGQEGDGNVFDQAATIVPASDNEDESESSAEKGKKSSQDYEIRWRRAFKNYMSCIYKKIAAWVEDKMKYTKDLVIKSMLNMLVPKIRFLNEHDMLCQHPLLPTINSPIPLLSILFFTDFAKSLADVTDAITVVSCIR